MRFSRHRQTLSCRINLETVGLQKRICLINLTKTIGIMLAEASSTANGATYLQQLCNYSPPTARSPSLAHFGTALQQVSTFLISSRSSQLICWRVTSSGRYYRALKSDLARRGPRGVATGLDGLSEPSGQYATQSLWIGNAPLRRGLPRAGRTVGLKVKQMLLIVVSALNKRMQHNET